MSKNENSELLDGSKGLVRIVGLFDLTLNVEGPNVGFYNASKGYLLSKSNLFLSHIVALNVLGTA